MKIALISVSPEFISIGLRMLSAVLKKEGHEISLIFMAKDNNRLLTKKELDAMNSFVSAFDLIGLSLTTNYFNMAKDITLNIKKAFNKPIVWGGMHPTVAPEDCLNYADFVCRGEGEIFLKELSRGKSYKDLHNVCYNNNGSLICNALSPLIQNLDALPILDLDENSHFTFENENLESLSQNDNYPRYISTQYTIMASRGCPYSCTYCCNDFLKKLYPGQRYLRRRSIDNVIEELKEAKKRMPFIKEINFADDYFLGNPPKEEVERFAAIYKNEVGLPFDVLGFSPGQCNAELMDLLINAGMKGIRMGVQSGSPRVLGIFNRHHLTPDKILDSAKLFHAYSGKISIGYDFILDLPWVTEEDERETFELLLRLPRPFRVLFYSFTAFPGTSLYEKAKQEGIVDGYIGRNYANIKNSYFNSLFYLYEFGLPKSWLRWMSNTRNYRSMAFRPFYLFLKNATSILKAFYILFKLYPLLILRGQYKMSKYEIRRGIDNLKKVLNIK